MPVPPYGYYLVPLSRTGWVATSNDVYYGAAQNALDGSTSTIWATNGTIPCWLNIDRGGPPSGAGNGVSITANLVTGSLVLVAVQWDGSLGSPTLSDGISTYTPLVARQHGSVTLCLAIWGFIAQATGSVTITTTAPNNFTQMAWQQFIGVTSLSVDATISTGGTGSSVSSGSLTTTNATDTLFGAACGWHNASVFTAGTGWTMTQMINGNHALAIEFQTASSAGSYAATFGYNQTDYWVCGLVAVQGVPTSLTLPSFDTMTVLPRQDGYADDPGSITVNVSNDGSTWTPVYSATGIPLSASLKTFGPFSGGAVNNRYVQYYISAIASGARIYQGACEVNLGTNTPLYVTAPNQMPTPTNTGEGVFHQPVHPPVSPGTVSTSGGNSGYISMGGGGGGGAVSSVFGRTGAVVATAADYSAFYPSLTGSYTNPAWIVALPYSKITGVPAPGTVIGFVMNTGVTGTNVGPLLVAAHAGSVSKCVVAVKASDASVALTFDIKQNGTTVFSGPPTISAGAASGTVYTFTGLTSSPLSVAAGDVFRIDISTGSASWQFSAQLET